MLRSSPEREESACFQGKLGPTAGSKDQREHLNRLWSLAFLKKKKKNVVLTFAYFQSQEKKARELSHQVVLALGFLNHCPQVFYGQY